MLTERMQILLTPEQRARLEAEAREQGRSVASLVREAIDARYDLPHRGQRLTALAAIGAMHGPYLSPDELQRLVGDERLGNIPEAPRP
ncbi:MAG: antitoxin [Candidatus Dormiibacterota bacterium]